MHLRPRLRTVLLTVNILILLLPLVGIGALRLYENALIRSTEAQLIVQGALVREIFRQEFLRQAELAGLLPAEPGAPPRYGRPLFSGQDPSSASRDPSEPVLPRLDIALDQVRPPAPDAEEASEAADPIAAAVGARIMPALQAAGGTTLAGIRVVDARGIVVATTRSELDLSLAHREEVARALSGENVSILRQRISDEPVPPLRSLSRGQRYRVFVSMPVIEHERVIGAVVLSRTPMDIAKALYLKRRPLIFGAAVLLGVVVLVSVLTSFTISRPVRALIHQAELVSRGEKGALVPLGSPGTHELARLSEALARMAQVLEDRAEYIRTFASHISHEFKTPLTTMRGTVELMRDHLDKMTPEERARFLQNLGEASARLERLVSRLLEKARADMLRPGDERTDVAEALDGPVQRHRQAGLDVTLEHGRGVGEVRMAQDTLEEIISNLLDNARQHGGENPRVVISTRLDRTARPPVVEVKVSDDGHGISDANAPRVFTPFFTTARERGGSGLGLSIVRSLLEAHGGTIELERENPGTTFRIRLPVGGMP